MPPVFVELKAKIGEFQAKMGEARGEIQKLEKEGSGNFDKLASVGKAALLGVAGVAIGVGGAALEMADKFEIAHSHLETAFKNVGVPIDEFKRQIGAAGKQMETFGFSNDQTQEALAKLTTGLNDPKAALADMSMAADIARARNMSLADAADLLVRVHAGGLRVLKQFGINTDELGKSEKQRGQALTAANAAVAASTDQLQAAQRKLSDLETIDRAKKKLTVSDEIALRNARDAVTAATKKHQDALTNLSAAQAQQGGKSKEEEATTLLAGKAHGYAADQAKTFSGEVAALKAKGEDLFITIGLHLIPILQKAAAVVIDVVHWFQQHKDVALAVGIVIGTVLVAAITAYTVSMVEAAVATIAATWPILLVIAIIAALVVGIIELVKHWGAVVDFFKHTWQDMKIWASDFWQYLLDGWRAVLAFLEGIPGAVGGFFAGLGKQIANQFIWGIDKIIEAWNWLVGFLKIPGFDLGPVHFGGIDIGSHLKISPIAMLAEGGIVTGPTLAILGERGPEMVTPLSGVGGGAGNLHADIYLDGRAIARVVSPLVRKDLLVRQRPTVTTGLA